MTQDLFEWAESRQAVPTNATVALVDTERLTGQNGLMLARLEQGPATGPELMALMGAMNPSARISDVRAWLRLRGKTIESTRLEGGVWEYRIASYGEPK
jgi:hypothetical protein